MIVCTFKIVLYYRLKETIQVYAEENSSELPKGFERIPEIDFIKMSAWAVIAQHGVVQPKTNSDISLDPPHWVFNIYRFLQTFFYATFPPLVVFILIYVYGIL